jgi:ATP-binding cassette subfamily F protein uup
MDQVVDHLFVFRGSGVVKDFPGSYTHYREWLTAIEKKEKKALNTIPKKEKVSSNTEKAKKKLSFKEKQEFEQLEKDIANLESEKSQLEQEISSGTLSSDDLVEKSNRIGEIINILDVKEFRWLELSEFI